MGHGIRWWGLLALGLLVPLAGAAQDPVVVVPGDSVRVWIDGGGPRVGRVTAASAEGLRWRGGPGGTEVAASAESLLRLEVLHGTRRHAGDGAAIGALAGIVLGALLADDPSFGVLGGVLMGTPLGFFLGLAAETGVWEVGALPRSPIPPPRPTFSTPGHGAEPTAPSLPGPGPAGPRPRRLPRIP